MRNAITPMERLSLTLRFFASGNSYADLKFLSAASPQSTGKIVVETSAAIIKVLKNKINVRKLLFQIINLF